MNSTSAVCFDFVKALKQVHRHGIYSLPLFFPMLLCLSLTGPDVWCNDKWCTDSGTSALKDGKLNSRNGFCRLEVDPYPFCIKLYWDGSGSTDIAEIPSWGPHRGRLRELWDMQFRLDVVSMRQVRQRLRGAAHTTCPPLHLPYEETTTHTRNTNKDNSKETYHIKWTYTKGKVRVTGDFNKSKYEQGFNCDMVYKDGIGIETDGSQHGKQHANGTTTVPSEQWGVVHSGPRAFQITPKLKTLLYDGESEGQKHSNGWKVAQGLRHYLIDLRNEYRVKRMRERYWENYSLSWSFWYLIYNNDMITMPQIIQHFEKIEQNPIVKSIVIKPLQQHETIKNYTLELEALTAMIAYFNCNPCVGYWYTFWHDVHKKNSDLSGIKKNNDSFDPSCPNSICYRPMGRTATETFLNALDGGTTPLGRSQSHYLDLLFEKIDKVHQRHPITFTGHFTGNVIGPDEHSVVHVGPSGRGIEMTAIGGGVSNGSAAAVWVDFAKNPVNEKADSKNIIVINDFGDGSACWVTADKMEEEEE